MLTKMGESEVGPFEIMGTAGHSAGVIAQPNVHPTPEALERAFERLEAMNQKAVAKLSEGPKQQ